MMDSTLHDTALLLLGHGSTLNADSSAPTYQHAEEIRRRGIFAEVHTAFWKEEPNFRQALRQTDCSRIYVVPNFISSGYFTEQVIPRELDLTGAVTRIGRQEIFYCAPVGLHPSMTEALLRRADEVVASSPETIPLPAQTACLFICGHGTSFNDNSTKIIHEQAALIRARGLFADCQAVLMEQTPFVKDWRTLTDCPDVIVVPFFISDGLHSFEDIPVLLGLTPDARKQPYAVPQREGERRLWYATAIGTAPFMAEVILAQVEQFRADHPELFPSTTRSESSRSLHDEFARFLENETAPWIIGEVAVRPGFELRHAADQEVDPTTLLRVSSPDELRELVRLDPAGKFRPLRAAPTLRRGWIHEASGVEGLRLALDYLYPAELANWALWRCGQLGATPWSETAERQTGRFRVVRGIDAPELTKLVEENCHGGCLKRRLWLPAAQTVIANANEIPLLCPEACNFLIGKAREKLKGESEP